MAKKQKTLSWTELDPDTLQPDAREAYEKVQQVHAEAKAAREHLQRLVNKAADLPDTHRLVFSYKFGHLSVAIDIAKPKNASLKAVNFKTLKAAVRRVGP